MKNAFAAIALAFLAFAAARAENIPGMPRPSTKQIQPVNVPPVPFETVSGTVTVRLKGVVVVPHAVTYTFIPAFPNSIGELVPTTFGDYFLFNNKVPANQPYRLTISATYNEVKTGRAGSADKTFHGYAGSVRVDVPYGHDFDFGVQIIDLN